MSHKAAPASHPTSQALLLAGLCATALAAGTAYAQTTTPATDAAGDQPTEVVITGMGYKVQKDALLIFTEN